MDLWRQIQNFCNWLQVNRVVYHPTEDTVITGSHDTTVRIWNVPTAQTIQVEGLSSVADMGAVGSTDSFFWFRIRDPVFFRPLDPDLGSRIRIKHCESYLPHLSYNFGLQTLNYFVADPDSGSGKEKFGSGIRYKHPGSSTQVFGSGSRFQLKLKCARMFN